MKAALPEGVKAEDVIHPTGIFSRNPTDLETRNRATDQSDIVKELTLSGRGKIVEVFEYLPQDIPHTLPGVLKIRTMVEEDMKNFFKSVMRIRPNIFKLHIKLGEHTNLRPSYDRKVTNIASQAPRWATEIGLDMAQLFLDKRLNVVEMIYTIQNAAVGTFSSTCEVFTTTDEEYNDDKLFNPGIIIEYYQNS